MYFDDSLHNDLNRVDGWACPNCHAPISEQASVNGTTTCQHCGVSFQDFVPQAESQSSIGDDVLGGNLLRALARNRARPQPNPGDTPPAH